MGCVGNHFSVQFKPNVDNIFQSVDTEFTGDSSLTLTVCDWFRPRLIVEFVGGSDGMLRRLAGMAGMVDMDMVDRWERLGVSCREW